MLSGYNILTVTHKSTNLKKIGDFLIEEDSNQDLTARLQKLKLDFKVEELMYLATCNRVMFFYYKQSETQDENFIRDFFTSVNQKLASLNGSLLGNIQSYQGAAAIEHLLEVGSSIDSLVLGEREILRQLRESYRFSNENGLTGDKIRIAMKVAVKAAKEVYAATRIGEKPVSVVSLSIKEFLKNNPSKDSRILMIGAGQTNQLATKFLKKHNFKNLVVCNRSLDRAKSVAGILNGEAITLEDLPSYSNGFDVLFVCTGATNKIISSSLYENLLNGEKDKKIIVDLAVPANVDTSILSKHDAVYIEVDSLKVLAKENMAFRENEISKVKQILDRELVDFSGLYKRREIEKSLSHIPSQIRAIKDKAINEVFAKKLDKVDEETKLLIEEMMTYMEKKCIAVPIKNAKKVID